MLLEYSLKLVPTILHFVVFTLIVQRDVSTHVLYKHYEPPSKPGKGSSLEPKTSFSTVRTTYDTTYNKSGSMNNVNGLAARFLTFGDVPSFPFIGGALDVVWNSPNCGLCWKLTNRRRAPRSILLLLIVPGLVSILHRRLSCD